MNVIPTLDWLSNPEIFRVNRIDAHSDHKFFVGGKELKQSLNGTWKFTFSPNPYTREADFYKRSFEIEKLDDIKVPGHMTMQGYGNPQYVNIMYPWDGVVECEAPNIPETQNNVGGYVKDITIDRDLLGKRLFISFQGVATAFYLYVNDKFVGYSEDSFTPSEFEITDYVTEGVNRIGVEVYERSTGDWLEDQDFWRLYGIFREVYLYAIPEVHVRDIFVNTDLDSEYKDATITMQADVINDIDAQVSYEVALYDKEGERVAKTTANDLNEAVINLNEANLWSAESPYLYDLKIDVLANGELKENVSVRVGIRKFEMINKIMCINGKRIEFRGVNRHEFSAHTGRVVTEEEMLWDIKYIKQNNMNSVRTCHYPDMTRWYELCDEYGIYLIDETNLETHGTWSAEGLDGKVSAIPGSKPEWLENVLDRAASLFNRDKNHASVLIWSCGNESHCGKDIYEMSEYFRNHDKTRLVHYEGVWADKDYDATTDMATRMYAKAWDIEKYLQNDPPKPYISCEYSHAMGNSNGSLNEYTDLYDKYPMYQGGFIWDYIDQALFKEDGYGNKTLGYGGDFGDRPTDGIFCMNGIAFADRTATPKIQEVKYLYQPISLYIADNGIRIKNRNLFTDTSIYDLEVWMLIDGVEYGKTVLDVTVPPLSEKFIEVSLATPMILGERIMQARFVLKEDTSWAPKGHEVAFGEKILENRFDIKQGAIATCGTQDGLRIAKGHENTGVYANGLGYIFSKSGGLISIKKEGRELIERVTRPCFYRASVDNDRGCGYMFDSGIWQMVEKWARKVTFKTEEIDGKAVITYEYELPICEDSVLILQNKYDNGNTGNGKEGIRVTLTYTVDESGECHVKCVYPGAKNLPQLPLFGVQFVVDKRFEDYSFYGKGPLENYCDRNFGARYGIFNDTATDNLTPYVYPTACGNRTEVRNLVVTDGTDIIEFEANNKPFECTVLHYTENQLEEANHHYELPKPTYTFVKIMAAQMGIGGDDSWGAQVHAPYKIYAENPIELEFTIKVR